MGEGRETHDFYGPKRVHLAGFLTGSRYRPPEFSTISAAKSRNRRRRKPKASSKPFNKTKDFSVADLFLTDG